MTNLIEKTLIIGFGIFTLIIFLSIITPFIQKIENIRKAEVEAEVDDYLLFIEKVDNSIKNFILNPVQILTDNVQIPENINISINQDYIRYDYLENDENKEVIMDYPVQFQIKSFIGFKSGRYLLTIESKESYLLINITK